jgi:hypothetical protein
MFRFHFWETVWYYKPTAKYPKSNFLPGRFVGIAWEHGDAFTYKIWTTPDDDWTKGRELIRNVVKSRSKTETEPRADYDESSLVWYKTKMTKTQIKRSKRRSKKRAKDEEEPASEETRKRLATPSDSPLIHNADSEEKGTSGIEQGNQPKTPIQNDLPENAETPSSTINSKRKFEEAMQPDAFTEFNPLDEDLEEIEMDSEVNDTFSETTSVSSGIG